MGEKRSYIGRIADYHTRIERAIRAVDKFEDCEEMQSVKRNLVFAKEEIKKYLIRVKFEYEKTRVEK